MNKSYCPTSYIKQQEFCDRISQIKVNVFRKKAKLIIPNCLNCDLKTLFRYPIDSPITLQLRRDFCEDTLPFLCCSSWLSVRTEDVREPSSIPTGETFLSSSRSCDKVLPLEAAQEKTSIIWHGLQYKVKVKEIRVPRAEAVRRGYLIEEEMALGRRTLSQNGISHFELSAGLNASETKEKILILSDREIVSF